jgi:hypothetical protein
VRHQRGPPRTSTSVTVSDCAQAGPAVLPPDCSLTPPGQPSAAGASPATPARRAARPRRARRAGPAQRSARGRRRSTLTDASAPHRQAARESSRPSSMPLPPPVEAAWSESCRCAPPSRAPTPRTTSSTLIALSLGPCLASPLSGPPWRRQRTGRRASWQSWGRHRQAPRRTSGRGCCWTGTRAPCSRSRLTWPTTRSGCLGHWQRQRGRQ